jgi:hypothetical protein
MIIPLYPKAHKRWKENIFCTLRNLEFVSFPSFTFSLDSCGNTVSWFSHFWQFGRKRPIMRQFSRLFRRYVNKWNHKFCLWSSIALQFELCYLCTSFKLVFFPAIFCEFYGNVTMCTEHAPHCSQLHACFHIRPVPASECQLNRNDYRNLMCLSAHIIT